MTQNFNMTIQKLSLRLDVDIQPAFAFDLN